MKALKTIIVGAGGWGRVWIEKVLNHPRLELVAVIAQTDTTLRRIAVDYHLDRTIMFNDLRSAFRTVEADIVVVVTPAACHLEHVRASMQAGKHVICEKPLADNWKTARQLAEVTSDHPDQKFMVAQTRRFTDPVETIRRTLASGRIGTIDTITFDHRVYCTVGGYRQKMALPVLEDMIIHHLDAIRYISGEDPVSVYAEAWKPKWSQLEGQGSNNVLATLTNDVHVNYFGTWSARGQLNNYDGIMKVMGSTGSLDLVDDKTLLYYPIQRGDTGPNTGTAAIQMIELEHREVDGVLHAFVHALDTHTRPPCDINDNLKTFAFNWAALQSCRTGQRIELSEIVC